MATTSGWYTCAHCEVRTIVDWHRCARCDRTLCAACYSLWSRPCPAETDDDGPEAESDG